ncbi:hypothetical protein HAX54_033312 [Datura stramonium]|uniref:Uncharacterized protein n=1 Tax=Datura stramonium TaxID=4076 RepID=A0ABS8SDH0_DATST|nr:hypothetical protein [Datura stramonium]
MDDLQTISSVCFSCVENADKILKKTPNLWGKLRCDAFPCLEHVVLKRCRYLKVIPSCFGYMPSLKSIEVKCARNHSPNQPLSSRKCKLKRWHILVLRSSSTSRSTMLQHSVNNWLSDFKEL